jgi:putative transposase
MMSRLGKQLSLSVSEKAELQEMLQKGVHSVRSLKRAEVLLSLHQDNKPEQVVQQVGVSLATVYNIAKRYEHSLASALTEKPRPGQPSKFDKALQAQLTALACSPAPQGHSRWTLRLLADKLVELRWVDSISYQAVAEQLKKTSSSLG